MLGGGQLTCPTKELNTDFVQQARVAILDHPRSEVLFRPLTEAYRDCIHTNDMMRRFEGVYKEATQANPPEVQRLQGILPNTSSSCGGVLNSLQLALRIAREHEVYERSITPRLRAFLWPISLYCDCR
jgi:hypothetical protein